MIILIINMRETKERIFYFWFAVTAIAALEGGGAVYYFRGGTPSAVIKIFWKFLELFNPYQNVFKRLKSAKGVV